MTVKVSGVKQAEKALEEAGDKITAALERVVGESAEAVREDARRFVPVDDGDLRDAIIYEHEGATARVRVATRDARYGHFVELGTSKQPAQPFMGPAAERERKEIPKRVEKAVKEATDG